MTALLLPSPLGPLLVRYDHAGLRELRFYPNGRHPPAGTRDQPTLGDELGRRVQEELAGYFAGERRAFDLPLAPTGTPFQRRVWNCLGTIPFGETRTYGVIARELGSERAVRAVGQANGKNPIALVVPCHRVVAAGGPGGYGGGLERKLWLLRHEAASAKLR
ncbi:MAG: methylated-DNA--[protein]-cysteine S-methyltransferase [Longimicrobiaceae bacterium]